DIPNLARLGTVGGRAFNDQAFRFDGVVDGRDGELRIDDATVSLANSDAAGSLVYRRGEPPFIEIDITSDRLSFAPLLVEAAAPKKEAPKPPADGRVIPDLAVPFDLLQKFDAHLSLSVRELSRRDLLLRNVVLDAGIENGALALNDLALHARAGFLRGRGSLEPADGVGRASLELLADELAFGLTPTNRALQTTMKLNVNLGSTGNDLRTLAGNATGVALFETGGGTVANNRVMSFFYGGFIDEILTTVNPFLKSQPTTDFECMILPIRITDGKLTSTPATLIRTDKLNLTIDPEIDLKSEKLDVSIQSTPRRRLSISAAELLNPYIKITGTMARPALAMDEEGVLISGGAAVATGGLSVLAKAAWDRLSRSGDPCKSARDEAAKALGDSFPDIEPLPMLPPMPLDGPAAGPQDSQQ
ncbi:MAG: AsmA-like C-terminal region-containing protein, partial [Woeseiaceae bacterium]|nr:AsmA-like C-terminal region-containing protein [Woeseiaceae bacterium]